jgi:hypothetical protein
MMHKFKFFEGFLENVYVFDTANIVARHVQHGERTLRATWRPEPIEDIYSHHGIDAEAELTRMLSAQWAQEIDNDIIRRLREIIGEENETDDEVLRGIEVLNGRVEESVDTIRRVTRRINGGDDLADNADYLGRYLDIGGDRA